MNRIPRLLSIADRLARARAELSVTARNGATTEAISLNSLERTDDQRRNESIIRRLVSDGEWDSTASTRQAAEAWVEVHWSPERDTWPP